MGLWRVAPRIDSPAAPTFKAASDHRPLPVFTVAGSQSCGWRSCMDGSSADDRTLMAAFRPVRSMCWWRTATIELAIGVQRYYVLTCRPVRHQPIAWLCGTSGAAGWPPQRVCWPAGVAGNRQPGQRLRAVAGMDRFALSRSGSEGRREEVCWAATNQTSHHAAVCCRGRT